MANSINWGKVYCAMEDNKGWGINTANTTLYSIPDYSAPSCWGFAFLADSTLQKADTTTFTADATIT
jgi:hypothetical protein